MTEGNTIDFLYYIRRRVVTERDKYHAVPQAYKFFQDRVDMCDMAIDSLNSKNEAEEYRTPAKVKVIHNTDPDAIESFEWVCPRCNTPHDEVAEIPYCFKCGQALDWTDEGFDKYMEEHGYVKHDYAK